MLAGSGTRVGLQIQGRGSMSVQGSAVKRKRDAISLVRPGVLTFVGSDWARMIVFAAIVCREPGRRQMIGETRANDDSEQAALLRGACYIMTRADGCLAETRAPTG